MFRKSFWHKLFDLWFAKLQIIKISFFVFTYIFFFFGSLAKNSQPGAKAIKIQFGRENRHKDTRIDGFFREQETAYVSGSQITVLQKVS